MATLSNHLLRAIPVIFAPEDRVTCSQHRAVPGTGPADATIEDGVVAPEDRNRVEEREAVCPMWFLSGENDRGGDTAGDVHRERGEAEGEDVEPLGQ